MSSRPWQIEHHPSLDSTNRLAADRIHAAWQNHQSPAGIVITAHRQTAGRGQHGRPWISPPGGLYLSAIVDQIPPDARDKLALLAGVTIAETLRKIATADIRLRWPNDLILHNKKLGGILCEALASGDLYAAIIGLGLNINTPLHALPKNLQPTATSLLADHNRHYDLHEIQHALLADFSTMLQRLAHEGIAPFIHRAQQLDDLRGKSVTFHDGTHLHAATAAGISNTGELLLLINNTLHPFATGTIITIDGEPLRP